MRINQLPAATEVAQNDVLAIDTPNRTYQVPRSVLAPSPYISTIPTGQWSGSDSDYYITVTASNVTADSILYPFFDSDSEALLNGPVWAVPAAGSFTIHTSAIPAGTVTISVLLAGVVGEAQYQVLSDVYSKSQVDSIVAQSTAEAVKRVSKTVTIPAGTSSLQEVQIDFSDVIPTGKNAILLNVTLAEYVLPYCDNAGAIKTWVYQWHRASHILTIKNLSTAWNNTAVILEVDMRQ